MKYTAERLKSYYPFDTHVIDSVVDVADKLNRQSWEDIQKGIPETIKYSPSRGKNIEVLDITPKDYDDTYVYYLPMANSLDANMSFRLAVLKAVLPTKRLIAAGNPSAPGLGKGKVSLWNMPKVAHGDLRPKIDPVLRYLDSKDINSTTNVGYSLGADLAVTATIHADKYDHQVSQQTLMEPASVKKRSLRGLGGDFASSEPPLEGYVKATESEAYREARHQANEQAHGKLGFMLGLGRPSNLAISKALTHDKFESRVWDSMYRQSDISTTIVSGTASELSNYELMLGVVDRLQKTFGDRLNYIPLQGQKHAMGDDVFLHAAMVLQADQTY